jgi:hypothetical protein
MSLARYKDLCIDAVDVERMGRFWSRALGLELDLRGSDPARLTGATPQHTVWVNPVPEAKTVKNRVHLDVNAASVEEIASLGATVLDDHSFRWTVMADPEGGELCVFVREGPVERRLYELVVDSKEPHEIAAWWADVLDPPRRDHGRRGRARDGRRLGRPRRGRRDRLARAGRPGGQRVLRLPRRLS